MRKTKMSGLISAIPTGIAAFIATNLDDLVILTLLFSQVNATFRRRHIVTGQYLGFSALVLVSLFGFLGGLVLPRHWIGLLGLVPIAIGMSRLFNKDGEDSDSIEEENRHSNSSVIASFLSPQTYGVAAITFANGSDNIGIYLPLFAKSDLASLGIILAVFFVLVGVWCYMTYQLTRQPLLAQFLTRYGNHFVPFVLIGLGVFIVLDSNALTPQALLASCLCLLGLVKLNGRAVEAPPAQVNTSIANVLPSYVVPPIDTRVSPAKVAKF
jgi:cadmium resistance transport/sequestration family protein